MPGFLQFSERSPVYRAISIIPTGPRVESHPKNANIKKSERRLMCKGIVCSFNSSYGQELMDKKSLRFFKL